MRLFSIAKQLCQATPRSSSVLARIVSPQLELPLLPSQGLLIPPPLSIAKSTFTRKMSTDQQENKTASGRPEGSQDLQLYSLGTPNGHKITIFLEEAGIPYDAHTIDIRKNTQFEDWYVKEVNPNSKIPALVDKKGPSGKPHRVFESVAILFYLGKKYRKFIPKDPELQSECLQWLVWQAAGFGPMLGQMGHFHKYAPEDVPYGKKRYLTEAKRLFGVLEKQLEGKKYVVGDELTIADFAIFPWARGVRVFYNLFDQMGDIPNVRRWMEDLEARPAVQRGLKVNSM